MAEGPDGTHGVSPHSFCRDHRTGTPEENAPGRPPGATPRGLAVFAYSAASARESAGLAASTKAASALEA